MASDRVAAINRLPSGERSALPESAVQSFEETHYYTVLEMNLSRTAVKKEVLAPIPNYVITIVKSCKPTPYNQPDPPNIVSPTPCSFRRGMRGIRLERKSKKAIV